MILRSIVLFALLSALAVSESAQETASVSPVVDRQAPNLSRTVFPITTAKFNGPGIKGWFGTGFCLDTACRFVGTNYHVAAMAKPRRINGERIVRQFLATSPEDEDATLNELADGGGTLKYTLGRDLAIFELSHPLRESHGVDFSLDELQIGEPVYIYAFPKQNVIPVRELMKYDGRFQGETPTGLLAFEYAVSAGGPIRPGSSGGLVVQAGTGKVVGVLNAIANDGQGIALAVPISSLAEFVRKVQPCLSQKIFPSTQGIPEVSTDIYPNFVESPSLNPLHQRQDESSAVKLLRRQAQSLADGMHDFIAVQTFAWGTGNKAPVAEAAYEVRVLGGDQWFREYPDGKKELREVPFPPPINNGIGTGDAWADLPLMVGSDLGLEIHESGDTVIDRRQIRVFQYRADTEDEVCRFKSTLDFGFFAIHKVVEVACYGEVWTDDEGNIVRMSEHLELLGSWKNYEAIVTYGWLARTNEQPRLVPLTIYAQAEYNKKTYWCRGRFLDYKVFTSRVSIGADRIRPEPIENPIR